MENQKYVTLPTSKKYSAVINIMLQRNFPSKRHDMISCNVQDEIYETCKTKLTVPYLF